MPSFIEKLKSGRSGSSKAAQSLEPTGAPIFLLVGSLSGCTKKDALQYARGLAEANIIAPAAGRVQVTHDKARDRWVYEVHEGGIEVSIADKVVAALDAGEPVRIALVNGAHVSIESTHGELFSLVHPRSEAPPAVDVTLQIDLLQGDVHANDSDEYPAAAVQSAAPRMTGFSDVSAFAGTTALLELFPQNKQLSKIGAYLLGVSFTLFMAVGVLYTFVQAGVFDKDALLTLTKAGHVSDSTNNPVWQLEKARKDANAAGTHITALKKGPTGWNWELSQ